MKGDPLFVHAYRLIRFGLVGGLATLTYLAVSIGAVKLLELRPSIASIIAIACGFVVSYVGHHQFTFRLTGRHHVHLPRFGVMQTTIFVVVGGLSTYLLEKQVADPTVVSVMVAIAWPMISFVVAQLWVFKRGASGTD
jgi:putative flippase GtrA